MARNYAKGAETPRFRKPCEAPHPIVRLRPCLVDGRPAFFHRWVEEDKALLKVKTPRGPDEIEASVARFHRDGVMDHICDIEKLHTFFALVEYEGGTVCKVNPELIRFLDRED